MSSQGNVVPPVDARNQTVWRFSPVTNAITFESIYAPGDDMTVTYPVVCLP